MKILLVSVTFLLGAINAQHSAHGAISPQSPLAGSWAAERKVDGQPVSYKVRFPDTGPPARGLWAVEANSSATGCFRGHARGRVAVVSSCSIDGSAGARDSNSVCPIYSSNDTRFVAKGQTLLWETRSGSSTWDRFVVLHRVHPDLGFSWPSECGSEH
jgi:hypothetical protein